MASSVYNQNRDAGVDFQQAVHLVTTEYNVNYEVMLRDFAPQEVFVQYGPEVRKKKYLEMEISLTYKKNVVVLWQRARGLQPAVPCDQGQKHKHD